MNKIELEKPSPTLNHNYHIVVNKLEEYMSVQPKSKHRGLYYQIIEQLKSGFYIIPIKISYFKHNDQIHQWVTETCKKEVQRCLKLAVIQFAQSQDIPIINPSFNVRLRRC